VAQGNINATANQGNVAVTAAQGNVNVAATQGTATITAPSVKVGNGGTLQPVKLEDGTPSTVLQAQ
jgi:hypothetical protein